MNDILKMSSKNNPSDKEVFIPLKDRILKTNELIYKFIRYGTDILETNGNFDNDDYNATREQVESFIEENNEYLHNHEYEYDTIDIQDYFNKMKYMMQNYSVLNLYSDMKLDSMYESTKLALALKVEAINNVNHLKSIFSNRKVFDRDIDSDIQLLIRTDFDENIEDEIGEIIFDVKIAAETRSLFQYSQFRRTYKENRTKRL